MPPRITFQPSGRRAEALAGETVMDSARRLGEAIVSTCGGQGVCGMCKVRLSGDALPPPTEQERAALSYQEQKDGYRLACACLPGADLVVYIPDESRASRQVVLKGGPARPFGLDPAVRNLYVELGPPEGAAPAADKERLLRALGDRYGVSGLSVAYPVMKGLPSVLRESGWKVTASVRNGKEVIRLTPGYAPAVYGAAFDIGTTTLAGCLVNLATGEVAATDSMLNPQVVYGDDVISRVSAAAKGGDGGERLRAAVVEGLNRMLLVMTEGAGVAVDDVLEALFVGNTVMHHLALGLPVGGMGSYPFVPSAAGPLEFRAAGTGLGINPCGYVVSLPVIGGFVGSDCTAALLVEEPQARDGVTLMVDIGTNGEIVIADRDRLMAASCATGPAFEGALIRHGMRAAPGAIERVVVDAETLEASYKTVGQGGYHATGRPSGARGICGSGVVDAVAQMYLAGIIDGRGAFRAGSESPRVRMDAPDGPEYVIAWRGETSTGEDITINQADVRAVQLAKAALRAGIGVLMSEFKAERPDRVAVAGAFGNYMDMQSALAIGMVPPCGPEAMKSIGNAAGDGAVAALLSREKRLAAAAVREKAEHVELSTHPGFQAAYLAALDFPSGGARP